MLEKDSASLSHIYALLRKSYKQREIFLELYHPQYSTYEQAWVQQLAVLAQFMRLSNHFLKFYLKEQHS
jgi:hypothetical protein